MSVFRKNIIIPAFVGFLFGSLMAFSIYFLMNRNHKNTSTSIALAALLTPTPPPSPTPAVTPTVTPMPTSTPVPTPTHSPTPRPTPIPYVASDLDRWFEQYSNLASVDKSLLQKIAACESEFKPQAINGDYAGLFQYSSSTWISARNQMNLDTDVGLRFSPEEAIKTAAFTLSTRGPGAWPNCSK